MELGWARTELGWAKTGREQEKFHHLNQTLNRSVVAQASGRTPTSTLLPGKSSPTDHKIPSSKFPNEQTGGTVNEAPLSRHSLLSVLWPRAKILLCPPEGQTIILLSQISQTTTAL